MAFIPRFLRFDGYKTIDIRDNHTDKTIEIHLLRSDEKEFTCCRCGSPLQCKTGHYRLKVREMPIMDFVVHIVFWRWTGKCLKCKKSRSETIDFISKETPHMTKDFSWWLGKLCEIAAVSNAADFADVSKMTAWRIDLKRMLLMLKHYKIPKARRICVDEVYARKKPKKGESRNKRFFTVITDLKTHKVIWVSESRDKMALDEFFNIIGKKACKKIEVVAMDQHDPYRASVREHCKQAKIVWDRFHLMKSFNEVLDTIRKEILENEVSDQELKRMIRGKYRYIFTKRDTKRTIEERAHLAEVQKRNDIFIKLELIKERLIQFFDEPDENSAYLTFYEIGAYIAELKFTYLIDWWVRLRDQWGTLKNYFSARVTTALSEGINNVVKTLKRKSFGFRNMTYFRLKIMQTCGYLNSKFIPSVDYLMEDM